MGDSDKGGAPCAAQFVSGQNNLITEWILATRVDYKINSSDTLFGRYHMDRGVQATGTDPINPVFNATSLQPEYDGQLTETHIFNPTTINNFIFSVQWYKALFGPPSFSAAVATFPTTMAFGDGLYPPSEALTMPTRKGVFQHSFKSPTIFRKPSGHTTLKSE